MKQYIDKSAVVAEIERIKKEECPIDTYEGRCKLFYFEQFLSFLNTLEVKEVENFIWNNARTTVPEDSTNQIICIKEDGLAVSTIGKIVNGTVKWAYLDDLLNTNSFNVEVKEVDLEEEIHRYYVDWDEHPQYVQTARHFAKWQKERMVDKACNFIYEQLNNGIMECGDIETFINNYRKYMEE